jgi:hypothetical protein
VPHDARIPFGGGAMFLSGANVAWVSFARDIGPTSGSPDISTFEDIFEQVGEHGGNSMRLWLHTNGRHTPEWGPDSTVVGPGDTAIEDLRAILDVAERHDVGLVLCLWSFDMLRKSFGDDFGEQLLNRNEALLRDSSLTETYIDNALLPMVKAVGDHPALLAWEIFNEPEGMSQEFGWDFNRHVPMADIQRFINQTAGAIRRADDDALVTNGAWSFMAQSDKPPKALAKAPALDEMSERRLAEIRRDLSRRYRHDFTLEEARAAYARVRRRAKAGGNRNYYRDNRLIEAGGDPMGVLDFYSVHYYDWAGTELSPFHSDADYWGLEKPLAVMEFHVEETFGVGKTELFSELLDRGYAGASGWSWTDMNSTTWNQTLDMMAELRDEQPEAVSPDTTGLPEPEITPDVFALQPPAPNPVENGHTARIVYDLSRQVHVTLDIFDAMGRRVATLVDDRQGIDRYTVQVNTSTLSSGMYFYRLQAGSFTETRRMAVVQ